MQVSLILVERKFSRDGQIIKYYQSKIEEAQISISKFEPSISLDKSLKVKK